MNFAVQKLPLVLYYKIEFVRILLQYVFRYRADVISSNLKNSFPEKTETDIKDIKSRYYRVMMDYLRETLQLGFGDKKLLKENIKLYSPEIAEKYINGKISSIILASHYGNWELMSMLSVFYPAQKFIIFYKPVSNKKMDAFVRHIRERFGMEIYPIDQTARIISGRKNEPIAYVFIADQTPFNMNNVRWNTFLHQITPWMTGAEKIAVKFGYPVLYLETNPNIRSIYHLSYSINLNLITQNPTDLREGEIIDVYAGLLEKQILKKPEYWLWSHRRWKRAHMFVG